MTLAAVNPSASPASRQSPIPAGLPDDQPANLRLLGSERHAEADFGGAACDMVGEQSDTMLHTRGFRFRVCPDFLHIQLLQTSRSV
jgi:hypothetical protein